jgi:DNA invertase Pin-like site-specific DNA recombinase
MKNTPMNNKIMESHLNRKAIIYLRQSTQRQVQFNTESQRLQYALKDKAQQWGWKDIEVIDRDLGSSAAVGAVERVGFDRLMSCVAVGEVGIIFSAEASRLSRTDKDWCRLLEVCGLFDTLISDGQQVYDSNCTDDQLLLGIKGTMSVVELKILRNRMIAGMQEKAKRGEFKRQLSPGYQWNKEGKIVKDPDGRVRTAIELVLKKFRQIQSIRQTFLWFHGHNIELPVTKEIAGHKEIVWQLPKKSYIKELLQNPLYAGVYAWGRESTKLHYVNGKVVKRRVRKTDATKSKVFIQDHHEGYIDLDTFMENQKIIRENSLRLSDGEVVGAAREGQGILGGILRCGRCGQKFYVAYHGKSGTAARYICRGEYESGGKYCLAFGGSTVDKNFSKELLRVLSPYGIEASIEAAKRVSSEEAEKKKAMKQKIQQLQYESTRAFEQYNEVDPRHRLVAAELERRWNDKLEELEKAREAFNEITEKKQTLTEDETDKLLALGERFSEVWGACPNSLRKKIIRTVISEVIVNLDEASETLKFIIHWKGGCHTEFQMPKPPSGIGQKTQEEDLEIIRKMAIRYADADIARVLNKLGRSTATGKRWSAFRVQTIRGKYGISGHTRTKKDPELLTLAEAAKYLKVSKTTIKRLVQQGILEKNQAAPWAPWEIKKSDLDSEKINEIIKGLRKTGKLVMRGVDSEETILLFADM